MSLPDFDYFSFVEGYVEGGWCYQETSSGPQIELPVALPPIGVSAVVSGTDTYMMRADSKQSFRTKREFVETQVASQVHVVVRCFDGLGGFVVVFEGDGPLEPAPLSRDIYKITKTSAIKGGTFMALPNLSHKIRRINVGLYRAAWFRFGMPAVTGLHSRSVTLNGVTTSTPTETTLYPSQSAFRGVVTGAGHAIEDTLHYPTYAKCSASITETETVTYVIDGGAGFVLCPPSWVPPPGCPVGHFPGWSCDAIWPSTPANSSRSESNAWNFPHYVQDIGGAGGNPALAPYLWHAIGWVRYLNTWPHALWSYTLAWSNWTLMGTATDHRLYWQPGRSQWNGDPVLAAPERTNTRNHIALDPLWLESGMSPFWDEYTDSAGWIGAARWQTRKVTPLSEFQYTDGQASLWTEEDCSIAHGADLVVTLDGGKTKGKIFLRLGDWNVAPYQAAHLMNEVFLDWLAANVDRVRAFFVGADGTLSELLKRNPSDNHTTPGHRYRRPSKFTTRPAGSWAIDNGNLIVPDTGVDAGVLGMSGSIMSNPERIAAFGLNLGRGAVALLLEITPSNPSLPVTIRYPKLHHASQANPVLIRESGHVAALLQKNGSALRWGNQTFTAGNSILPAPTLFGQGDVASIVDALCWSRTYIEGVQHASGVVAEIAARYDPYEGQSVAQCANFGLGVLLPAFSGGYRFALVNTIAEVPPLQCFPHSDRDESYDEIPDSYTNDVWSWAQGPIHFVYNSPSRMYLRRRSGSAITSPISPPIEGWKGEQGDPAVNNSEAVTDYEVVEGTTVRARTRPWRGYFAIGVNASGDSLVTAKAVAYHVSPFQRHLVAIIDPDDAVKFAFFDNHPIPASPVFLPASITSAAAIAVHFDSSDEETPFLFVVSQLGILRRFRSVDEATWTDMTIISPGGAVDVAAFIDDHGVQHIYWSTIDKTLVGQLIDRTGNVLSSFTIVGSDVRGPLSHFVSYGDDNDNWRVLLWYVRDSDGALIQIVSPDGENFS